MNVVVHYLMKTDAMVLNISASGTVRDLLTKASKRLPGTIASDDLVIEHGDTPPPSNQKVVHLSLKEPFHISK